MARRHRENFHVVSLFLPRELRPHFLALYGYCRGVDDLGDEAAGDRSALLDAWERELDLLYAGSPADPVFQALLPTVRAFDLPPEPFRRLIEANRIDQRSSRHRTFDSLLDYCTYSAHPVGRLVLMICGSRDPGHMALSDATCTALQLANFWQDVTVDWAKGRVYLPQEDLARFGCPESFAAGPADDRFRTMMRFQVERTRDWFARGVGLAEQVEPSLRLQILLFTAGGWSVLDRIERLEFDVLNRRPALTGWDKARLLWSVKRDPAGVIARVRSREPL